MPTDQTPRTFRFRNEFGENWLLTINADSATGTLTGDDLGEESIEIEDNQLLDDDLILAAEEAAWLKETWRRETGQEIELPPNPFA